MFKFAAQALRPAWPVRYPIDPLLVLTGLQVILIHLSNVTGLGQYDKRTMRLLVSDIGTSKAVLDAVPCLQPVHAGNILLVQSIVRLCSNKQCMSCVSAHTVCLLAAGLL